MKENPYINKIIKTNKSPKFKILIVSLIIGITAISAFAVYTTAGTATYKPTSDIIVITPEPEPTQQAEADLNTPTTIENEIIQDATEQQTSVFSLVQPDSAVIGVPPTGANPETYIPALQYHATEPEQAPGTPLSVTEWHLYRDTWSVGEVLHGYAKIVNNCDELINDTVTFTGSARDSSIAMNVNVVVAAHGTTTLDYQATVIDSIEPGAYDVTVVATYHDAEIGRQTFTINIA